MLKRLDNKESYRIEGEKGVYIVTLERLKNDVNGNSRFHAEVTDISNFELPYLKTRCFNFSGHFSEWKEEAVYIVGCMEESFK